MDDKALEEKAALLKEDRASNAAEVARLREALGRAVELMDCWGNRPFNPCREGNRCPACLVAADAAALRGEGEKP